MQIVENDLTHGMDMDKLPQHGIQFGDFESKGFRLHLHERMAVTPDEKEVTASIPYMQGVVDVSKLLGNRIYENREITYTFYRFWVDKHEPYERSLHPRNSSHTARDFQTTIENLLMREFDQTLKDTYEPDFHYIGKCKEVVVTDEYNFNRLRVEITFDLYPFKIDNHMESADFFDPFNFDIDAFQNGLSFEVTGVASEQQIIHLYNASQKVHSPTVEVEGEAAVRMLSNGIEHSLITGNPRTYPNFRLQQGMNTVALWRTTGGVATVYFDWRKERI